MDYTTETVTIGLCFCEFTYKNYLYFLTTCNLVKSIVYIVLGVLSSFPVVNFGSMVMIVLIALGSSLTLLQILNYYLLYHSSTLLGCINFLINCLMSFVDFSSGTIMLILRFNMFIQLNSSQISAYQQNQPLILTIACALIIFGMIGFWLTYLLYQTYQIFNHTIHSEAKVVPKLTLKETLNQKFNRNHIEAIKQEYIQSIGESAENVSRRKSSFNETPMHQTRIIPSKFKTEKMISFDKKDDHFDHIIDNNNMENNYYYPSSQHIKLPTQMDEIKSLRRISKTPKNFVG